MAHRLSLDDSALFCTWGWKEEYRDRPAARPLSLQDTSPERPRAPSPASMLRHSGSLERAGSSQLWWTCQPGALHSLERITVSIWDTECASPHPRNSRSSMHSVSSSSSSSTASSLLSDLDQSIASWASDSSTASSRTLRKRLTPHGESLRDIRTRQSDFQLQLAYESSLSGYLDDSYMDAFKPSPLRTSQIKPPPIPRRSLLRPNPC